MRNINPVAERIASQIESEMRFENPEAQRVMRMCAEIARREGQPAPAPSLAGESSSAPASLGLMRIEDVSEMTGVTLNTLRFWRSEGKGPKSAKMGRRVVYRESDVRAWLDAQFDKAVGDD